MIDELSIRSLLIEDLPSLLEIENKSFSLPWSEQSYRDELVNNDMAHYLGLFVDGKLAAYGGFWLIFDEAHICNIAVAPQFRRRGLGEALLRAQIALAASLGVERMTLEVRVSNDAAQGLYKKLGFRACGIRPKYYQDNNEDALIMWLNLFKEDHNENFGD
ncbi:MAG: ribosomal protein S18-alanine N-acetyltransferase [Clostridia bacterium]|nr:ribosomal protein S18-alanine N-acetyltransferase [Clostridia bacterium]MDD4798100.1 ribosomal protein S18-alanine N-acetyltransferase [Clostridia bacterium]